MSCFYGGDYFGGEFHALLGDVSGPFFDGKFFDGGFFGETEVVVEADAPEVPKTGGKGDNSSRRRIFKPTGLPPYREVRKPVEDRIAETHVIAREVAEQYEEQPIAQMALVDIEAEIGELLRKKLRTEDEEIMLLLLMAVVA